MSDLNAQEAITRWDRFAEQYADAYSEYGDVNKEVLLTPLILELLGHIEDKRILDAGCGEGFLSRLMAERGALVTGVDYSKRFLEIARRRTPAKLQIDYVHGNLESIDVLVKETFDIIVSCLVIQDVPDYQGAIRELYRVLRPGGICILAIVHPCFSSDGEWVKDATGEKLYWKIDNYFYERAYEMPWPPDAEKTPVYFHRTLTSYFKTITDAGFAVNDLIEPYPSRDAIARSPGFENDMRMCHFLVLRLEKAGQ